MRDLNLRNAVLALVQEEADDWCSSPDEVRTPYHDLVEAFNDEHPDNPIDLSKEVRWHG